MSEPFEVLCFCFGMALLIVAGLGWQLGGVLPNFVQPDLFWLFALSWLGLSFLPTTAMGNMKFSTRWVVTRGPLHAVWWFETCCLDSKFIFIMFMKPESTQTYQHHCFKLAAACGGRNITLYAFKSTKLRTVTCMLTNKLWNKGDSYLPEWHYFAWRVPKAVNLLGAANEILWL